MKLAFILIFLGVPLAAVGLCLFLLYAHFIAPFGTTGLSFFVLGGGLVIFGVLWRAFLPYFHFIVRSLEELDRRIQDRRKQEES